MPISPKAILPDSVTAPIREIDRAIDDAVGSLDLPPNLTEAIRYAACDGGKRVRPLLAWHCAGATSGSDHGSAALPAAVAVELIHAFSLVHDDLPAMDDDDLRRGKPTLHVHAGEAMAILAGDAMLSAAFTVLARGVKPPERATRLIAELAVGTNGMIAGQVFDTLGGMPAELTDAQRLELVHRSKTGALLRAACRLGAMSVTSSEADLAAITAFGESAGLMFQIIDDILDVEQTAAVTGKRTGKDEAAGKLTYPGVLGVEASRAEVARLADTARRTIEPLRGPSADALRSLVGYLAERTA